MTAPTRLWKRHGIARLALLAVIVFAQGCSQDDVVPPERRVVRPFDKVTLRNFDASAFALFDDTTVVLLDRYSKQVVWLTPGGRERRFGKQGGGPGEFGEPIDVLVVDSTLIIADIRPPRLTSVTAGGVVLGTWPAHGIPLRVLTVIGDTIIYAAAGFPPHGAVLAWQCMRTAQSGVFFEFTQVDSLLMDATPVTGTPSPFLATAHAVTGGVIVGSGHRYRVAELSRAGRVVRAVEREGVAVPAYTTEELAGFMGAVQQIAGARAVPDEVMASISDALNARKRPYFHQDGVNSDARGRIWVLTNELILGARTALDVFGADGALEARYDLEGVVTAMEIRQNVVATLIRGNEHELGLQEILFYRLR